MVHVTFNEIIRTVLTDRRRFPSTSTFLVVNMTSRQGQNLPFSLQKLLNLMQSVALSKDRRTRRSSNRRFSFESIILVQAKQDLDDLLTRQVVPSPTQSSQSVENREVWLN